MRALEAYVEGIGLIGPGFESWESGAALLSEPERYRYRPTVIPVPDGLPPAERRRLGTVVKLALSVGMQATRAAKVDPATLLSVFTSSGADGQNCHEICSALAQNERLISPTRFHNSVHNAAAGYWSIATRSTTASNALCAFDASLGAGLLEAFTLVAIDRAPVLLIAYDSQYPHPLHRKRPIPDAFALALILTPDRGPKAMTALGLQLSERPFDRMAAAALETLRAAIPAARALPLLQALAQRRSGVIALEYLDGRSLAVESAPCH